MRVLRARHFFLFAALTCACQSAEPAPPAQIVAAKKDASPSDEPLLVYVAADGIVRLDGRELLEDGSILAHAREYEESHVHGIAIVRSAPAALHGRTVRVVQLLEEAKIPSVAIDRLR
jgi:biopolymer transport protein ExbD